jgi:mannose-6-phosphate isomerase-like protein (cupin superfamily)
MPEATHTPWLHPEPPARHAIERIFREAKLSPRWWSNGLGAVYGAHSHSYHKVLYCSEGSITFRIEPSGPEIELHPGDRLDIPPGTAHSAFVGPRGVTCVEAPRCA